MVAAPGWDTLPTPLRDQIRDELNVVEIASLSDTGELIELSVKPNFRALGRRFGGATQSVAAAIAATDPAELVATLRAGGATVDVDGSPVELTGDDVVVSESPRSGWAVSTSGADTVALDLELTHELRLLGLIRDVVRIVQEARKDAGLDVTDRIDLAWRVGGSPEPAEAIRSHEALLAREVLARTIENAAPEPSTGWSEAADDDLGLHIWLRRASPAAT